MDEINYLPLFFCKKYSRLAKDIFGSNVKSGEIKNLYQNDDMKLGTSLAHKYWKAILALGSRYNNDADKIIPATDTMMLVMRWELNKQIYKFDKDFLDELIKTENPMFLENMWDHLPYRCFYIDFSDNTALCSKLCAQGMYIYTEKAEGLPGYLKIKEGGENEWGDDMDLYIVHVCAVNENSMKDIELHYTIDFPVPCKENLLMDSFDDRNARTYFNLAIENEAAIADSREVALFVYQILIYLSSAEPDISESELTKYTYRKRKNKDAPKNTFSEIQAWDVGIRFGASFRKWEQDKEKFSAVGTGTGNKKRPHCRRAHYHCFWYGPKEGPRVKRAKWLSDMYINTSERDAAVLPAVVHETDKKKAGN